MKREWKAGDVATIIAHRFDAANRRALRFGTVWVDETGAYWDDSEVLARPLTVIDPEDKKAVARLAGLYSSADNRIGERPLQAALREFANPIVKPDEPLGLGAVVQDARGNRWVLVANPGVAAVRCWRSVTADEWFDYADVPAVRVLSEGVTS